jgi:hypothetical protein
LKGKVGVPCIGSRRQECGGQHDNRRPQHLEYL